MKKTPVIQTVAIPPQLPFAKSYSLTVDLPGPGKGKIWTVKSIGAILFLNSIQAGLEPACSFFSVALLDAAPVADPLADIGSVTTALDFFARGAILSKGTDCSIYRGSIGTVITGNIWNTGVEIPYGYKLRLVYTPQKSAIGQNISGEFGVVAIESDANC